METTVSVATAETEMTPFCTGSTTSAPLSQGVDKARDRINALQQIIGPFTQLDALLDADIPAKSLLQNEDIALAILAHVAKPSAGHEQDALCRWLYDTFQTNDPDLQNIVLRFIPALCGLYLPQVTSNSDESLAGFEAVLLALYNSEGKGRNGRSLVINIPDLSQPSLYHAPRIPSNSPSEPLLGQLYASLEPQDAVTATKRTCIVGVAMDLFCRKIASMPQKSKIEACQCINRWAMLGSSDYCARKIALKGETNGESSLYMNYSFNDSSFSQKVPGNDIVGPGDLFFGSKSPFGKDHQIHQNAVLDSLPSHKRLLSMKYSSTESRQTHDMEKKISSSQSFPSSWDFPKILMQAGQGVRVQLPWEMLQPLLRILGHCLLAPLNSEEVREAASAALRTLHMRVAHDLLPEAILATRSLIRLGIESKSKIVTKTLSSSSSKPRKPEVLLVSK